MLGIVDKRAKLGEKNLQIERGMEISSLKIKLLPAPPLSRGNKMFLELEWNRIVPIRDRWTRLNRRFSSNFFYMCTRDFNMISRNFFLKNYCCSNC